MYLLLEIREFIFRSNIFHVVLTINGKYLFKISRLFLVTDKPCVCCGLETILLNAVYVNLAVKGLNCLIRLC